MRGRQGRLVLAVMAVGLTCALFSASASAQQTISSPGPLTDIHIGETLSCQVEYAGDPQPSFFGGIPGSCGTFVRESGGGQVTLVAESQSGVLGSGTAADPYRIVTG